MINPLNAMEAMGKKAVNELRGSGEDIIEIIKAMAMEMDGDEIEAAMEVMEFIGEEFKIDFELSNHPRVLSMFHLKSTANLQIKC